MKSEESAPTHNGPRPPQKYFGFQGRSVPPRMGRKPHVIKLIVLQAGAPQADSLPTREELHSPTSVGDAAPSAGVSLLPSASNGAGSSAAAPSHSSSHVVHSATAASLLPDTSRNVGKSRTNSIGKQDFIGGTLEAEPDNATVALAHTYISVPSASTSVEEDCISPSASVASNPCGDGGRQLILHEVGLRAKKQARLTSPSSSK